MTDRKRQYLISETDLDKLRPLAIVGAGFMAVAGTVSIADAWHFHLSPLLLLLFIAQVAAGVYGLVWICWFNRRLSEFTKGTDHA